MKISSDGLNAIKAFEGLYLKAYRCPAGVLTIGWGCTEGVYEGQIITRAQAETLLQRELMRFEDGVRALVKVPLTQHQFDALVSFSYNVGLSALGRSTLLRKLNAGDYAAVPAQLARWNQGGGRVLAGLVKRRRIEGEMWSRPGVYVKDFTEPMAQSVKEKRSMLFEIILGFARHLVTGAGGVAIGVGGGDLSSPVTWLGVASFLGGAIISGLDKARADGVVTFQEVFQETLSAFKDHLNAPKD